MMWMGLVSAWGAVVLGLLFVGFAGTSTHWSFATFAMFAIGVVLMIGAVRTLRKMSGGLRLLAGAWGLAAGFLVLPFAQSGSLQAFFKDLGPMSYGIIAAAIASVAGLALTVLHQERK